MINIALSGSTGQMGRLLKEAIEQDPEFRLLLQIGRNTHKALEDLKEPIDVFIDFTLPEATMDYLNICLKHSCAMVIGTTGLTLDQMALVKKASHHIPIVFSPNMSIGVNVCYKLLDLVSRILKDSPAKVEIVDIHHQRKKDAPSGTALRMKEVITKAQSGGPASDIKITSKRIGEVMGEHTILFELPNEQIEITHKASNRMLFALGALKAAKWVVNKPSGLYDMQDLL